jgi:hypothetical protein
VCVFITAGQLRVKKNKKKYGEIYYSVSASVKNRTPSRKPQIERRKRYEEGCGSCERGAVASGSEQAQARPGAGERELHAAKP